MWRLDARWFIAVFIRRCEFAVTAEDVERIRWDGEYSLLGTSHFKCEVDGGLLERGGVAFELKIKK